VIIHILFQIANQLSGAANFSLYGEKIKFACARTSSAVIEDTSILPPDSAIFSSLAARLLEISPAVEMSSWV